MGRVALRADGLGHAHVGWMFRGKDMANPGRYAGDLVADRDLRFISRTFPLWVLVGLAVPFGLGVALTGSIPGGLTGLLWGGAVRIFVLHHTDIQHQLAVPLLRPAAIRHGRRVATSLGSRRYLWRGMAQRAPRVPTSADHGLRCGSSIFRQADRGLERRPCLGRRTGQPEAPAGEA